MSENHNNDKPGPAPIDVVSFDVVKNTNFNFKYKPTSMFTITDVRNIPVNLNLILFTKENFIGFTNLPAVTDEYYLQAVSFKDSKPDEMPVVVAYIPEHLKDVILSAVATIVFEVIAKDPRCKQLTVVELSTELSKIYFDLLTHLGHKSAFGNNEIIDWVKGVRDLLEKLEYRHDDISREADGLGQFIPGILSVLGAKND